jgi:two-component system sensor histidine kinase/response regulator
MRKVLVIDDEEALRSVVRTSLSIEGYDVVEAAEGAQGLELARTQQPALILCDVHMQGMDGYTFLENLRKDPVNAATPVILMTGIMKDYSSVRRAMGIGADDYLLKPFSVEDLIAAVHMRLQKQQTLVRTAESKLIELRSSIALSLPHELRTPLVAILGFSDLLKSYYETMERKEIGEMASDIHRAANRLHNLIENFLIFAQIEVLAADQEKVNTFRSTRTPDLHTFLKLTARRKAEECARPDDLKLNLSETSASISADYFEKIILALLDNAFKFSQPGTAVEVRCARDDEWMTCVIEDHGRGMTPEQIMNVGGYMQFERKMYEQQGSGLGLVIAKRLLEIHGGSLTIESRPGAGTTATARLPYAN